MALPICAEALVRTFFSSFKLAWDFWFYALALLMLMVLFKQGKIVIKILIILAIVLVIAIVADVIGISFVCELLNGIMKWIV
ncbi:MAG: hypothetical protein KJ955_01685 [Nanoarchaeota archaeon]|nr:hypothetical protein [Nanoarchaeota archaeon]